MKKIALILTLILSFTLMFTACGEQTASYANDIPVADLCAAADAVLPADSPLTAVPDDYITGMMEIDVSAFADYAVKIQASGANIDEYGIFKAPNAEAVDSVAATATQYLAKRVDTWMPEYMPEEFPKMQKASVKKMGEYVVYCILADDAKEAVFTAIENKLLGK